MRCTTYRVDRRPAYPQDLDAIEAWIAQDNPSAAIGMWLCLPEVQRLAGLGRSVIYQQMRDGLFPHSIKVGPRAAS